MRREKTLKVCANFFVKPGTKVAVDVRRRGELEVLLVEVAQR